jgi:hypothetical protein
MNADSGKIAVIATRLPYIDRRALSEAWFSALHLASDGPIPSRAVRGAGADLRESRALRGSTAAQSPASCHVADSPHSRTPSAAPPGAERRGFCQGGGARAGRTACAGARAERPFRTSLTVGVRGERVALSLRRSGGMLHIVAVCRPEVAAIVSRALACAGLYLRARGESVCARVQTVEPEGPA